MKICNGFISKMAVMSVGIVATLGGTAVSVPATATAATQGSNFSTNAKGMAYSLRMINPDASTTDSYGSDLADNGSVLVNDNENSYVLVQGKFVKLSQGAPGSQKLQVFGRAMNDSLRIVGYGSADPNGSYVQWDSPSSSYSLACTDGGCATDVTTYPTTTKLNSKNEELVAWSGHSGPWATFIDASGASHSLPGATGKIRAQVNATGLSDAGQVVGWAYGSAAPRAFVTSSAGFAWLKGSNVSGETHADAISPSGNWIVGGQGNYSQNPPTNNTIIWNSARKPTVIPGVPAGFVTSSVNDKGWFVGAVNKVAYLVRDGKATPLSALVNLPKGTAMGTTICDARDINASGQILANTCAADGSAGAAVLLTPSK